MLFRSKYLQYVVGTEGIGTPYSTDWDDRFNNCMEDQLNNVFSNPVSTAWFLTDPPGNTAAIIVGCAWEATFSD